MMDKNKKLFRVKVIENFYDKQEGKNRIKNKIIEIPKNRKDYLIDKKVVKEIKNDE